MEIKCKIKFRDGAVRKDPLDALLRAQEEAQSEAMHLAKMIINCMKDLANRGHDILDCKDEIKEVLLKTEYDSTMRLGYHLQCAEDLQQFFGRDLSQEDK